MKAARRSSWRRSPEKEAEPAGPQRWIKICSTMRSGWNGRILRIAREGDNIFALTQNMMMTVVGVFVLLFFFCIMMANYFTKNLVAPIEQMAENLSEPGTQAAYKELVPFMNKIRQQHEDILKSSQVRQEFTANVSHELKTPLSAISGYAELIEHGMSGENTERFASEIHKNAALLRPEPGSSHSVSEHSSGACLHILSPAETDPNLYTLRLSFRRQAGKAG